MLVTLGGTGDPDDRVTGPVDTWLGISETVTFRGPLYTSAFMIICLRC
jgi:hypothetical protein